MAEREIIFSVTLQKPIVQGTDIIEHLDFVEPDLNALECMDRGSKISNMNGVMKLLEKCANIPPSVVGAIGARDLGQIMEKLGPFLLEGKKAPSLE